MSKKIYDICLAQVDVSDLLAPVLMMNYWIGIIGFRMVASGRLLGSDFLPLHTLILQLFVAFSIAFSVFLICHSERSAICAHRSFGPRWF